MKDRGIFWIASYPKSGNTWVRAFLHNILSDTDEPVAINHFNFGTISNSRNWMDKVLGFNSSDLSLKELNQIRPDIYKWSAKHQHGYQYHKTHEALQQLSSGDYILSQSATAGVLYIIRNPLDISLSLANHLNCSIDKAILYMNDPNIVFGKKNAPSVHQFEYMLGSWSTHIASWINAKQINLLAIRYEDLTQSPEKAFHTITGHLRLNKPSEKIKRAIHNVRFTHLKAQEAQNGFAEKLPEAQSFFRKGIVGEWKTQLSKQQISTIIKHHGEMMFRYDYLDHSGNPIKY